jgi:RimJ/RimL family protein N-acetyltransferase
MVDLIPMLQEHIEWIRVKRNIPELYRYFRQDRPISKDEQIKWWRNLDKRRSRLFLVVDPGRKDGDGAPLKVGYSGFLPFNHYALSAEFGIFIVPEEQGKGYGKAAMLALLAKGFREYRLSNIYSDVLEYPGEDRWPFYEKLGFKPYADACQGKRYRKQGVYIPSKKFYMTRDGYEELHGDNGAGGLGTTLRKAVSAVQKAAGKGKGVHSG